MDQRIAPGLPIFVQLRVHGRNGMHEFDAVLDTGAAFVTIPTGDAVALGYSISNAPRVEVTTASGVVRVPKITLSRVSLGELEEMDVPALCLDIAGGSISSLLGLSLLSRFKIVIDPRHRLLSITRP
jgi:clan AA aspartic protease (TIGR02281 family)